MKSGFGRFVPLGTSGGLSVVSKLIKGEGDSSLSITGAVVDPTSDVAAFFSEGNFGGWFLFSVDGRGAGKEHSMNLADWAEV